MTTGIAYVKYGPDPICKCLMDLASDNSFSKEPFDHIIKIALTCKDTCWNYDHEMRILRERDGNVSIDKSYLQMVCFGLNTSASDMDLVQRVIARTNYDIRWARMMRKTTTDFGIEAIDIA